MLWEPVKAQTPPSIVSIEMTEIMVDGAKVTANVANADGNTMVYLKYGPETDNYNTRSGPPSGSEQGESASSGSAEFPLTGLRGNCSVKLEAPTEHAC